jgi:hypothetical protein
VTPTDQDAQFFSDYPDRRARIRLPEKAVAINRQRAAGVVDEMEAEFRTLCDHNRDRRRVLVWRVPEGNPFYDPARRPLLKIPFLLFADETVEDNDETLLPLVHQIMVDAAKEHGMVR